MLDIELTILYDYYKNLLTEKQKNYFEDYYFNNLSLSEIAEKNNITRNGIHRVLKETEIRLKTYENKLSLYENRLKIEEILKNKKEFKEIEEYI